MKGFREILPLAAAVAPAAAIAALAAATVAPAAAIAALAAVAAVVCDATSKGGRRFHGRRRILLSLNV